MAPEFVAHINRVETTVNVPHDKRKTKPVAEEQDVGNRERAEGCSNGRG